jgi:hypothetical protein
MARTSFAGRVGPPFAYAKEPEVAPPFGILERWVAMLRELGDFLWRPHSLRIRVQVE